MYLAKCGISVRRLKNNFAGWDWAHSFLKHHKQELSWRVLQNIKVSRSVVILTQVGSYYKNLDKIVRNVPPNNTIKYGKTNLSDDQGNKKVIVGNGCKHPQRLMNFTVISTSIIFACTGAGKLLPPCCI